MEMVQRGWVRWAVLVSALGLVSSPPTSEAATYYVRQTVGDDDKDGLSPATAWQHVLRLSTAMHAGDTAYVGPGLYREEVTVINDGTPDARLTFIADSTGVHTGDPPGVVMLTGAEPMDGGIFAPEGHPGVFKAPFVRPVWGVVEMDGDQFRYWRVKNREELPLPENVTELDLVAQRPSSYYYDEKAKVLYLHTGDGNHPSTHEMEFMVRGNGIAMQGKHYVTIIGFTFRSMGDAGINFFRGSSHGLAINNTSWGSRQGIRVYGATDISVYGNTLFRNENCGVYFALGSNNALIVGNTMYENIKGVRWSSQSVNGTAVDNVLFDHHEAGISVENADYTILRRNTLVNNEKSQLLIIQSDYTSDENCFATGGPDELIADFYFVDRYKTLLDYQQAKHQDLGSRGGSCGPLPGKIDVHKLHAESKAYAERARRILSGAVEPGGEAAKTTSGESPGITRRWLDWWFGR